MASCGRGFSSEATAIEDTIRGYFAAYNAEEFSTCLTNFTDFSDEQAALDSLRWMRGFLGEITLQKIEDIAISGKTASATVSVTLWGEPETEQMQFKKLNGIWKIVWAQEPTQPPPQIPAERRLPGTVEIAPELQGIVELEHCLWFGEDEGLNFWYQIRNIGDQTLHFRTTVELYKAMEEWWGSSSFTWELAPGQAAGGSSGSQCATEEAPTHYNIIVKSE